MEAADESKKLGGKPVAIVRYHCPRPTAVADDKPTSAAGDK